MYVCLSVRVRLVTKERRHKSDFNGTISQSVTSLPVDICRESWEDCMALEENNKHVHNI